MTVCRLDHSNPGDTDQDSERVGGGDKGSLAVAPKPIEELRQIVMDKGRLFRPGDQFATRNHALTAIAEECELRGARFRFLDGKNGLNGSALIVVCSTPIERQDCVPSSKKQAQDKQSKAKFQLNTLTQAERMERAGVRITQHNVEVAAGRECSFVVTAQRSGGATGKTRTSAFTLRGGGTASNPVMLCVGEDSDAEDLHDEATAGKLQKSSAEEAKSALVALCKEENDSDEDFMLDRHAKEDSSATGEREEAVKSDGVDAERHAPIIPGLEVLEPSRLASGKKGNFVITEMRGHNASCRWGVNMIKQEDRLRMMRSNLTAYSREMLAAAILPWFCQQEADGRGTPTRPQIVDQLSRYVHAPLSLGQGRTSCEATSSMVRAVTKLCEKHSKETRANSMQLIQGLFSLLNKSGVVAKLIVADGKQA